MKIYTKTGDKGSTALIGGARVKKDDLRIETFSVYSPTCSSSAVIWPAIPSIRLRPIVIA